eukprot:c19251_g1_i2.p1 GENE.c19251_g1_i2~~c19251_g1_i2.p1  ORF type:complete len:335 (+),score=129.33 c19251_g1_i2:139-1143(+)
MEEETFLCCKRKKYNWTPTIAHHNHFEYSSPTPVSIDVSCYSLSGKNSPKVVKENQDNFFVIEKLDKIKNSSVFCVLDGHGKQGAHASNLVKQKMGIFFENEENLKLIASNPKEALRKCFEEAQTSLKGQTIDFSLSGTTCNLVYLSGNHAICANAGDSRSIIVYKSHNQTKIQELSIDHKPELPQEQQRIEAAGGRVEPVKDELDEFIGPKRVWLKDQDTPGLMMTRSIGDFVAQSIGVIWEPEFIEYDLDFSQYPYLILASDGIWEFLSNEEVANLATSKKTTKESAGVICENASQLWKKRDTIQDDITLILAKFDASFSGRSKLVAETVIS